MDFLIMRGWKKGFLRVKTGQHVGGEEVSTSLGKTESKKIKKKGLV